MTPIKTLLPYIKFRNNAFTKTSYKFAAIHTHSVPLLKIQTVRGPGSHIDSHFGHENLFSILSCFEKQSRL